MKFALAGFLIGVAAIGCAFGWLALTETKLYQGLSFDL